MDDYEKIKNAKEPDCFEDLNLNQIVDDIILNKEEYNLAPFFYLKLSKIEDINYRINIMKELDNEKLYEIIYDFSANMKKYREYIEYSKNLHYDYQRKKWHLDLAKFYCDIVLKLFEDIKKIDLNSKGFKDFNVFLDEYINSINFKEFLKNTMELNDKFDNIKYNLKIYNGKIEVNFKDSDEDYCKSLESCFDKINKKKFDFKMGVFNDIKISPVEDMIIKLIKNEYKDVYDELVNYCENYIQFENEKIINFDREIQFYMSYTEFSKRLKNRGYKLSYPEFTNDKTLDINNMYDLALALKTDSVVGNDLNLNEKENIFILSGPNQGGKTTFARSFGQTLYLALLGCPVPCDFSKVYLFDGIYTHFSNDENLNIDNGKLKEELLRLEKIIEDITPNSILILNELFATTTTYDAYKMGKDLIKYFTKLECLSLYVTHISELSKIDENIVNLVAQVDDTKNRTYKILRKEADGKVYANKIVEKYNLSYEKLSERLKKISQGEV
jgi:DNA mismatch repair ATPase MutS